MKVSGFVTLEIKFSVNELETDTVSVNQFGGVNIDNEDTFFGDWVDAWNCGEGELLGVISRDNSLHIEPDDDDGENEGDEE